MPRAGLLLIHAGSQTRLTVPFWGQMGQFGWALPGSGYPLCDTSERRLVIVS